MNEESTGSEWEWRKNEAQMNEEWMKTESRTNEKVTEEWMKTQWVMNEEAIINDC